MTQENSVPNASRSWHNYIRSAIRELRPAKLIDKAASLLGCQHKCMWFFGTVLEKKVGDRLENVSLGNDRLGIAITLAGIH
jgi:hypothetical protein